MRESIVEWRQTEWLSDWKLLSGGIGGTRARYKPDLLNSFSGHGHLFQVTYYFYLKTRVSLERHHFFLLHPARVHTHTQAGLNGLTGRIEFNEGKRNNFKLDLLKLKREELVKVGEWKAGSGVNITDVAAFYETSTANITLVVMTREVCITYIRLLLFPSCTASLIPAISLSSLPNDPALCCKSPYVTAAGEALRHGEGGQELNGQCQIRGFLHRPAKVDCTTSGIPVRH